MSADCLSRTTLKIVAVIISLLIVQNSVGQGQPTLLRLQRSKATVEVDATGGMRGSGGNIMSLGGNPSQMGTATYPSSASCIVVYSDGRFVVEKRDEHTVGKPKVKAAEGTLDAGELQILKSILDRDEMKKISSLKVPEPPAGAQLMREAETMEVQIARESEMQHFLAVKERFKTAAPGNSDLAAAPSTGMDVYLNNASAYEKTLNPLVKWFEGIEKKSKSSFKDAKPQYCSAMTI